MLIDKQQFKEKLNSIELQIFSTNRAFYCLSPTWISPKKD